MYFIQNGVDVNKFKYNNHDKYNIRKKLNIPSDKIVFVSTGSLIDRKDPLFILKNFKEQISNEKAYLIMLGNGYLFERCKSYESKNILIMGNVDDVVPYLNASDVYISASRSEGLPNAVLEAAACGLEQVLSNIPQHKEIFENCTGLANFFELDNKKEFNTIINKIINKEKEKNNGISQFILNNFSAEANSYKYSKLYESIVLKNK